MTEFVNINGQAIRVTRFYRRTVNTEFGGTPVDEIELVVMLRGRTVQRAFQELLRQPAFQLEIPDEGSLQMRLESASLQTSGTGEAAAHRYDVTFRETGASAASRVSPATSSPPPAQPPTPPADTEGENIPEAPEIDWEEASVAWASALRGNAASNTTPVAPPDEPLTSTELAGVEAVLVGLRLEALIGAMEQAGIVRREAVDQAFVSLVEDRFVIEATPVVGEDVARRAAKTVI